MNTQKSIARVSEKESGMELLLQTEKKKDLEIKIRRKRLQLVLLSISFPCFEPELTVKAYLTLLILNYVLKIHDLCNHHIAIALMMLNSDFFHL